MDQTRPGGLADHIAALIADGLAAHQGLQQQLAFSHRHHGALRQPAAQLLVEDADGTAAKHHPGSGLVAPRPTQAAANQAHVAQQLAVVGAHEPQAPNGTPQALEGIAGIEHLKRVLQGVAAAAIDGGVDLDVAPGKHQQGGAELVNRLA